MRSGFATFGIVAVLAVAAGAWLALERRTTVHKTRLIETQQAKLKALERQWAEREVDRQLAANEAATARRLRQREELLAALGGPVGAALKDPTFTLTEMIEQVALACAGQGRAHARPDRFTEFSVFLELPAREERRKLAELARCLLTHTVEYVHRIQFMHGGKVIAELDRRGIESINDWKAVSAGDVEKLLIDPERAEPPEFVGAVRPASEEITHEEPQNLPEDVKAQREAEAIFSEAYRTANQQLHGAIELQSGAALMAGVKTSRDLDARLQSLTEAERLAAEAKRILGAPVAEYERILRTKKLDPLYIRAATRTSARSHNKVTPAVLKVFEAFEERARCAAELVTVMKKHFGAWTYQPFQDRIEFHDPAAERDYSGAGRKMDAASQRISEAFRQWKGAVEAGAASESGKSAE